MEALRENFYFFTTPSPKLPAPILLLLWDGVRDGALQRCNLYADSLSLTLVSIQYLSSTMLQVNVSYIPCYSRVHFCHAHGFMNDQ